VKKTPSLLLSESRFILGFVKKKKNQQTITIF